MTSTSTTNTLHTLRGQAEERFRALGFPTPRLEDWKFTNAAPIANAKFGAAAAGSVTAAQVASARLDASFDLMVFVNGRYESSLSKVGAFPKGATVMSMDVALSGGNAIAHSQIGTLAEWKGQAFTALNTSRIGLANEGVDGLFVHLAKGVELERPLEVLFLVTDEAAAGEMHPRNLIIAERHSRAQIIEHWHGLTTKQYFTNAVTEIGVDDEADVALFRLQREGAGAFHVGTVEARQGRASKLTTFSFATGAALSRMNLYTSLNGDGAECWMDGLYYVDGKQHTDHQTKIVHVAPNCPSHEVYKGILDGSAHAVFNGKVYVHPEAQKTDGKQSNANLLLSDKAVIDTKPQLEIFADDVKCTHGATVGRLDEVGLFYMKSRGIPDHRARTLLTYAFAADVLERIPVEALKLRLEEMVLKKVEERA